MGLENMLFLGLLGLGVGLFLRNIRRLSRSILQGKPLGKLDRTKERFMHMLRLAFGQQNA